MNQYESMCEVHGPQFRVCDTRERYRLEEKSMCFLSLSDIDFKYFMGGVCCVFLLTFEWQFKPVRRLGTAREKKHETSTLFFFHLGTLVKESGCVFVRSCLTQPTFTQPTFHPFLVCGPLTWSVFPLSASHGETHPEPPLWSDHLFWRLLYITPCQTA